LILEKLSVRSHLYLSLFLSFLDFWIIRCCYFILRIFFHYMWYLSIESIVNQCNEGKFTKTITATEIKDEQKKLCESLFGSVASWFSNVFRAEICQNKFFYFLKIIFKISASKLSKTYKELIFSKKIF
jgi:hypothetical protein